VRLLHDVANIVDGRIPAAGGVGGGVLNVAPFSCTVWYSAEYWNPFRPPGRVGRPAEPPGNVKLKVCPGATLSGAMTPIVTS
jgi:hypothetical protein